MFSDGGCHVNMRFCVVGWLRCADDQPWKRRQNASKQVKYCWLTSLGIQGQLKRPGGISNRRLKSLVVPLLGGIRPPTVCLFHFDDFLALF